MAEEFLLVRDKYQPGLQLGAVVPLNGSTWYDSFPGACVKHNGDFLVMYRSGVNAHAYASNANISQQTSSDEGQTWSSASVVISGTAGRDRMGAGLIRLATPNYLGLITGHWPVAGHDNTNVIEWYLSTNDGSTWGSPVTISYSWTGWAVALDAPIQLPSGRLLLAMYGRNSGDTKTSAKLWYSDNDGSTWTEWSTIGNGPTDGRSYAEPGLVILNDGSLLCMLRETDSAEDDQYYSTSADGGATWSTPALAMTDQTGAAKLANFGGNVYCSARNGSGSVEQEVWIHNGQLHGSNWALWNEHQLNRSKWSNYGAWIQTATDLYLVWAEDATATNSGGTDSDLYCRRVASARNVPYISDTFTRSGTTIGWSTPSGSDGYVLWGGESGGGDAQIVSNKLVNVTTGAGQNVYVGTPVQSPDGVLTMDIVSTSSFVAFEFRMSTTTSLASANGYQVALVPATNSFTLQRWDSGVATTLDTDTTQTINDNVTYQLTITLDGPNISATLSNGSSVSAVDSTYQYNYIYGPNLDNEVSGVRASIDNLVFRPAVLGSDPNVFLEIDGVGTLLTVVPATATEARYALIAGRPHREPSRLLPRMTAAAGGVFAVPAANSAKMTMVHGAPLRMQFAEGVVLPDPVPSRVVRMTFGEGETDFTYLYLPEE